MSGPEISREDVARLLQKLDVEGEAAGYHLNPDIAFAGELVQSLLVNKQRYGYRVCPCRLASGNREDDRDIICPCDYRDADIEEYGACYCALYVSGEVKRGEKTAQCIPERRPPADVRKKNAPLKPAGSVSVPVTVWRCIVCGYLCARDNPPGVCPICKAEKDRFEVFLKPS